MATDRTDGDLQALVPPFPLVLWEDETTVTEAGPKVGTARPQGRVSGRLLTSGSQSTGGFLKARVQRAGFPGRAGAGLVWQNDGDDRWRGKDAPTAITAPLEVVRFVDGSLAALVSTANPHAVTLPDDSVLVAYGFYATNPSTLYGVRVERRAADGSGWSSTVTVYSQSTDLSGGFHPCLLLLPSGRVVLYHGVEANDSYQIRAHLSDDNGATWEVMNPRCLPAAIDAGSTSTGWAGGRIRAAYSAGQVLLLLGLTNNNTNDTTSDVSNAIVQYASRDLGATFTQISTDPPATDSGLLGAGFDIVGHEELGFAVARGAWSSGAPTRVALALYDLPHAWTNLEDATPVDSGRAIDNASQPSSNFYEVEGDASVTLVRDDSGVLWAFHQVATNATTAGTDQGAVLRSFDRGRTWNYLRNFTGLDAAAAQISWWYTGDASTHPARYHGVAWRGRILLVTQWDANPGNEDNSVAVIHLGGWSTVTLPGEPETLFNLSESSFNAFTWLPIELPSDCGATNFTTGTATQALTAGRLVNTTTSGTMLDQVATSFTTIEEGVQVQALGVQVDSGGSLTANDVALALRIDDGSTTDYEVVVRFTTTGFRVYDVNAAALIQDVDGNDDVSVDTTSGIDIRAHLAGGRFALAYRVSSYSSDADYIMAYEATGLSDGGGTSAQQLVTWGNIATATATSRWGGIMISDEEVYHGSGLQDGQTNPDDLRPGIIGSRPIYLDDGVSVRGDHGPFLVGEVYNIETRPTWPVENLLSVGHPSTRRAFRSTTGSPPSAQSIAWRHVDGYSTAGRYDSLLILLLAGCNWRTASLQRYRSGWSNIASVDLATNLTGLPYQRIGNTLVVDTGGSSTGPWYMHRNTLIGATVDLGSSKLRRVIGNTDGVWTTAGTVRRPLIALEGVDDTEPSSGTLNLWMPGGAVIVHLAGTDAEAAGYRLVIGSQSTYEGDLRAKAHLGPGIVSFVPQDPQRTRTHRGVIDEVEFSDGARRRALRGPRRRSLTVGWQQHEINVAHVLGTSPSPDYKVGTTAAGANPLASWGATPFNALGLIDDLNQGERPLGWVGRVPLDTSSPGVWHVLEPHLSIWGYATPEARVELGRVTNRNAGTSDFAGTMARVAEISIEEVP